MLCNQFQLLKKGFSLKQVLGFAHQIELGADLPDDEAGAEEGADEEGAPVDPDVEEEKKLERGFPAVLLHRNFRRKLLHLWGVDEDACAFDAHDEDAKDDGRVFQKEWVGQEAEYESPGGAGEQDEGDDDDNAAAAVLGEPAGEEVEEDGDAREADEEVAQPRRLNVLFIFQHQREPQVTEDIPHCWQESENE